MQSYLKALNLNIGIIVNSGKSEVHISGVRGAWENCPIYVVTRSRLQPTLCPAVTQGGLCRSRYSQTGYSNCEAFTVMIVLVTQCFIVVRDFMTAQRVRHEASLCVSLIRVESWWIHCGPWGSSIRGAIHSLALSLLWEFSIRWAMNYSQIGYFVWVILFDGIE